MQGLKMLVFGSGLMLLMALTSWSQLTEVAILAKASMFVVGLVIAVGGLMRKD